MSETIQALISLPFAAIFLIGLIIGSFLNVCIHRLPRHLSVVRPASRCTQCGTTLRVRDNIPVLSFLLLRGRCRTCRARISIQYPLIELANAVGYVLVAWHFGLSGTAVLYAIFVSALLVITSTDLSHRIIPDVVTIPGTVLGLVGAATVLPIGLVNALVGALLGAGLLWLAAWSSPYLFGKEGMGGGDIKLLAMIGAFLGWKPALLTILLGALSGSIVGILLIVTSIMRRDAYLPFGPFLAFGAIITLFFHDALTDWYLNLIENLL